MAYRLYTFIIAPILLLFIVAGCAEQDVGNEIVDNLQARATVENQFSVLLEQARWGNGDAYLQLAELHHKGNDGNQDFLASLSMLMMADQYGGISSIDDYLKSLPSEDNFKLFYDAVELFGKERFEESLEITDRMISNGFIEGYTLKGFISVEQGDTIEGKRILSQAADQGSSFAELLLATLPGGYEATAPNITSLTSLADRIPLACKLLGDIYSGIDHQGNSNEELAVMFYKKADEYGCLGRRAARWLLGYYTREQIPVGERELERLSILAGNIECSCNEDSSVVQYYDSVLEDSVETILVNALKETNSDKGIVYVVETKTGRLIANVSIEREYDGFVPFADTYNQGRTIMVTAASYLALLESGKVKPETEFDTGNGVYGDVRDHNWYRGGYGQITLERALELRSEVAFTIAKEYTFGDATKTYEEVVDSYLGGDPNHSIGILTFYNAVANGGRMVKIVSEGDYDFVLNEQIAEKEHIALLQKGLKDAVKDGIFKKVGCEYVDVAANGRRFSINESTIRMELCGYFPTDNPKYTVMVIMEKEGLPASAGGMCGPVLSKIANMLMQ